MITKSPRGVMNSPAASLRVCELLENTPRRLRIGDTGVGQGDFAGSAEQELGAEPRLKISDLAAELGTGTPRSLAAAERLPFSIVARNIDMASKRSIELLVE